MTSNAVQQNEPNQSSFIQLLDLIVANSFAVAGTRVQRPAPPSDFQALQLALSFDRVIPSH